MRKKQPDFQKPLLSQSEAENVPMRVLPIEDNKDEERINDIEENSTQNIVSGGVRDEEIDLPPFFKFLTYVWVYSFIGPAKRHSKYWNLFTSFLALASSLGASRTSNSEQSKICLTREEFERNEFYFLLCPIFLDCNGLFKFSRL